MFIYCGLATNSPYPAIKLNSLLDTKMDRSSFYTDIFNNVIDKNGDIKLLPLSFDIPGLIFNKNSKKHTKDIDISDFLKNKDIIFSPFWDNNFNILYYLTELPYFNIEDNFIDKDIFIETTDVVLSLIKDRDDKWNEELFNKKYLHVSPELLIKESIIDYYFYSLSSFINLNPNTNSNISFSSLSRNGLVTITNDMTYIGINEKSKNVNASMEVLSWIFKEENQTTFIKNNFEQSGLFKMFNGELSTLKKVTEESLPLYYKRLEGLIPTHNIITTPSNLPVLWDSLKQETFIPIYTDIKTINKDQRIKKYLEYYNDWSKRHNK